MFDTEFLKGDGYVVPVLLLLWVRRASFRKVLHEGKQEMERMEGAIGRDNEGKSGR